jgi:hypothetical protein
MTLLLHGFTVGLVVGGAFLVTLAVAALTYYLVITREEHRLEEQARGRESGPTPGSPRAGGAG